MINAKAVVFPEKNQVEFQSVTCPDPGPTDVVVRLRHSWISNGTEGSFLRGERIAGDVAYRPGDPIPFPIVAGYQKVGVVDWVGAEVTRVRVGQTVFCTVSAVNGMFDERGGHVSPAVTDQSQVWPVPNGVDPLAVSGLVLTQVGYNCGARPSVDVGDTALVIGDGMVGLWAAQTLSWRGCRVILAGRHEDRLARFQPGFGRETVDTTEVDLEAMLERRRVTLQVIVDSVGSIEAISRYARFAPRFAHVVSAGFYGVDDLLAVQQLRNAEIAVDLVSGWTTPRLETTLELVGQGHLETLPLITNHFPAAEAATAWRYITEKRENALGVILDWEGA